MSSPRLYWIPRLAGKCVAEITRKDVDGFLSSDEAQKLAPKTANRLMELEWDNDEAKIANELAMHTGMRAGEIQALTVGDLGENEIYLNWAMHQDEMGAPHFHLRRAWPCKDEETGLTTTDQTKSLLKAGILPPDPEKKISKKNNPKMTFDKICREKWIFIARSHGLEIEDTPKPR